MDNPGANVMLLLGNMFADELLDDLVSALTNAAKTLHGATGLRRDYCDELVMMAFVSSWLSVRHDTAGAERFLNACGDGFAHMRRFDTDEQFRGEVRDMIARLRAAADREKH